MCENRRSIALCRSSIPSTRIAGCVRIVICGSHRSMRENRHSKLENTTLFQKAFEDSDINEKYMTFT